VKAVVVDVNVPIVANGAAAQADDRCRLACITALKQVRSGIICLDDDGEIMSEYRKHLSPSGQPGVGDEFMYWLVQNQYNANVCERVRLQPDPQWGYEQFPHHAALGRLTDRKRFDPADRKYVAVALASRHKPVILNAVDPDWFEYRDVLARHGAQVNELCHHLFENDGD
jgi:hypothetical protein